LFRGGDVIEKETIVKEMVTRKDCTLDGIQEAAIAPPCLKETATGQRHRSLLNHLFTLRLIIWNATPAPAFGSSNRHQLSRCDAVVDRHCRRGINPSDMAPLVSLLWPPAQTDSEFAMTPSIDLSERRTGKGVIWVNSSHDDCRYVREAERSAKTVRRFVEHAEFVLVSDRDHENLDAVFNFRASVNFHVPPCLTNKTHFNGQMIAKLSVLKEMTWERNLYLGADVAALRPGIDDIFRLLDHFDIAIAHAPVRINIQAGTDEKLQSLPWCFPEMNCDLIAYRRSDQVGAFLSEWEKIYSTSAINHQHDQGAFRYLLYKSGLRPYILPPEYNYRGHEFSPNTIISQRREAIPQYASRYAHIAEIYGL